MAIFAVVCEGYLGMMPHWGEEASAGRLPQPGAEDWPGGGTSRVHPDRADVEPRPMGFSMVLPL